MDRKPGCLVGLIKLKVLDVVFDWLQERFGFGRGCSCTGVGCGVNFTVIVFSLCLFYTNQHRLVAPYIIRSTYLKNDI